MENKFGDGWMDRMQIHYHSYKLLTFSCLYMTIEVTDLCVVQKKYEDISRNVNCKFEKLTYKISLVSYTRSTGVQLNHTVWLNAP